MIGICAICETEHDLELLANGEEENTVWEEYLCPVTGETFTHLHSPTKYAPDVAPVTSAEPDSGLESVPAVEAGTQPRG